MRGVAWIAALVCLGGAVEAQALMLCRTKAGALAAREACRKKETAVALTGVGAPGPQGTPGAPGASRAALYLADAAGVEVGPVLHANPFPIIVSGGQAHALLRANAVGGAAILVVAEVGEPVGFVFHASAECSDPGFVDGNTFMPVLQVIGDAVFRPVAPAGTVGILAIEQNDTSLGCTSLTPRGGCCITVSSQNRSDLSTVATTSLSGLGFAAPFHLTGP